MNFQNAEKMVEMVPIGPTKGTYIEDYNPSFNFFKFDSSFWE